MKAPSSWPQLKPNHRSKAPSPNIIAWGVRVLTYIFEDAQLIPQHLLCQRQTDKETKGDRVSHRERRSGLCFPGSRWERGDLVREVKEVFLCRSDDWASVWVMSWSQLWKRMHGCKHWAEALQQEADKFKEVTMKEVTAGTEGAWGSSMVRVRQTRQGIANPGRSCGHTQGQVNPQKGFTQSGSMIIVTIWEDCLGPGVKDRLESGRNRCRWRIRSHCVIPAGEAMAWTNWWCRNEHVWADLRWWGGKVNRIQQ